MYYIPKYEVTHISNWSGRKKSAPLISISLIKVNS